MRHFSAFAVRLSAPGFRYSLFASFVAERQNQVPPPETPGAGIRSQRAPRTRREPLFTAEARRHGERQLKRADCRSGRRESDASPFHHGGTLRLRSGQAQIRRWHFSRNPRKPLECSDDVMPVGLFSPFQPGRADPLQFHSLEENSSRSLGVGQRRFPFQTSLARRASV